MVVTEEHLAVIIRRAKEYGAKRLILFGSALETPENANDIDLAADIPGLQVFDFADDIEKELGCTIDIVPMSKENEHEPFIQYVLDYGKSLL